MRTKRTVKVYGHYCNDCAKPVAARIRKQYPKAKVQLKPVLDETVQRTRCATTLCFTGCRQMVLMIK